MKYLMLHSLEESRLDELPPDLESELEAWVGEMVGRGIELDGARLHPIADATTVRKVAGDVQVTDGPFAETKEQIAGYDVIDCPDLDSAIAVASAHPTLHIGSIEVRPFDEGMPDPEVPEAVTDGRRRYLMLVCADMREDLAAADATDTDPDSVPDRRLEAGDDEDTTEIDAWIDSLGDRRIYGYPLAHPNTAVTVRRVGGRVLTTDGPFAETKEQVAGYDLLECHDLDEALTAAATHPVAQVGVIEVRPLWD